MANIFPQNDVMTCKFEWLSPAATVYDYRVSVRYLYIDVIVYSITNTLIILKQLITDTLIILV